MYNPSLKYLIPSTFLKTANHRRQPRTHLMVLIPPRELIHPQHTALPQALHIVLHPEILWLRVLREHADGDLLERVEAREDGVDGGPLRELLGVDEELDGDVLERAGHRDARDHVDDPAEDVWVVLERQPQGAQVGAVAQAYWGGFYCDGVMSDEEKKSRGEKWGRRT